MVTGLFFRVTFRRADVMATVDDVGLYIMTLANVIYVTLTEDKAGDCVLYFLLRFESAVNKANLQTFICPSGGVGLERVPLSLFPWLLAESWMRPALEEVTEYGRSYGKALPVDADEVALILEGELNFIQIVDLSHKRFVYFVSNCYMQKFPVHDVVALYKFGFSLDAIAMFTKEYQYIIDDPEMNYFIQQLGILHREKQTMSDYSYTIKERQLKQLFFSVTFRRRCPMFRNEDPPPP